MLSRNIASFICIFATVVMATVHKDSHSVAGSDPGVTVYPLTTENLESSTREPDQPVMEILPVELGALLDAGHGAVVTLVAGDARLAAHRAVLAARSPVLAAMLQRVTLDARRRRMVIPDVEGPVLRQLLAYMYTLQAPQLPSMAPQLLAAADTYGLSSLKAHCEQQVAAQLSVETAAAAAVLAVRHSCSSLRQAAVAFIKAHILHVMATQGWADAAKSQPDVWIKVLQLLSDPPTETSAPAAPEDSGATPATQLHSEHGDHGQILTSAVQPTAFHSTIPYDAAAPHLRAPSTAATAITSPATWPHTGQSDDGHQTSASAVSPTAPSSCSESVHHTVSGLPTPAPASISATPATQPHSDHSGHSGLTPASAAPATAANHSSTPDYATVSPLWSLSAEEKNRRLIKAGKEGAVEEVEALLAAGADVGAIGLWKRTALHWAALEGPVEVTRRLLAAGAAVDARDSADWTPLHLAAYSGHAAVVRLLVEEASADPNARTASGLTPLHVAAINGRVEAAAALLQAGADTEATDNRGRTVLDVARQTNYQQLKDILGLS